MKQKLNSNSLSVVLATRNEEANIGRCLASVQAIASEIIVFDEYSTDKTIQIAQKYGATVYKEAHHEVFHVTKQKAIDMANGKWILQLDADEVVTPKLGKEILEVINMSNDEIKQRKIFDTKKRRLFEKHLKVLEARDGKLGKQTGEIVAFFVPRINMFLGKPLIHAGVYPDAVIRLIKKGKAYLPAKSVHEQMVIEGEVSWLFNDLEHYDSPTLRRYLERMNRYTSLHAKDYEDSKLPKNISNFLLYSFCLPFLTFIKLFFRHKGFKDGIQGFLWSAFSSMRFPLSYYKYITNRIQTSQE